MNEEDTLKPLTWRHRASGHHFFYLLASMLMLFVVHPFISAQSQAAGRFVLNLLFFAIMLSGMHAVTVRHRVKLVGWSLVIPALICRWAGYFTANEALTQAAHGLDMLFYVYFGTLLLLHVMRSEAVTIDKLMAALVVYLLIGLAYANMYYLIESFNPQAFEVPLGIRDSEGYALGDYHPMSKFIYFSFVTITTLGYGDITPAIPMSQSFTALEAIMGQFYLTVLVARLVGLHIAHRHYAHES